MSLHSLIPASPWAAAVALTVTGAAKIIVLRISLRGSDPKDRANIIKAVAEMFRWWNRSK